MKRMFEQSENENKSTAHKKTLTFSHFYEKNINWMDDGDINPIATLKQFYPTYFQGDAPDYEKIRADISTPYTKKSSNKAHELFKCLFKIPYKTLRTVTTDDLETLEKKFGAEIRAHGVEEAKGGMYNLLLMCVSNQVRVPSAYWGAFTKGLPNISPRDHGPYYLIYSTPFVNQSTSLGNNANLSDVARILVPFSENKEILTDKLEEMVQVELITPESKAMFIDKLVTYQEFHNELNAQAKIKEATSHLFFQSTPPSLARSVSEDIAQYREHTPGGLT